MGVKYFAPAPHGCGRDHYIHMRDEVRKGKAYLTNSSQRKKSLPMSSELSRLYYEEAVRQSDVSSRLATPSGRQQKAAQERSRMLFAHELGRIKMAVPFSPGVTLREREEMIRQIYLQEMSPPGSPLCFSPPESPPLRIPRRGRR